MALSGYSITKHWSLVEIHSSVKTLVTDLLDDLCDGIEWLRFENKVSMLPALLININIFLNNKYCIRSLSPRGHPAPCSLPTGIGRPHIHASPCARRRGDDRSEERVQCARSYRMYVEIECGGYLKAISGHTWAKHGRGWEAAKEYG